MVHYVYQLYDTKTKWTGHYIWKNKSDAEEICEQMNKDREKVGLKRTIKVRTLELS